MAVNNNDLDLDFEVEVGGSNETQKESLKDMFKDPFSHMRTVFPTCCPLSCWVVFSKLLVF